MSKDLRALLEDFFRIKPPIFSRSGNITAFLSKKKENQEILKKLQTGSTTGSFDSSNLTFESSIGPVRPVELQL